MESLLLLNKQATFAKLQNIQCVNGLYVANDIIDVLSDQRNTDRTMLNSYTEDEIRVYKIHRKSGTRLVRLFTIKGLARYLHEGKIYAYETACEYFGVQPIDRAKARYEVELSSMRCTKICDTTKYDTKKILKWLFNKRKSCKALGETTTVKDIVNMFINDDQIDDHKFKYLVSLCP